MEPAPTQLADIPHDVLMLVLWHLRYDFYPRKRLLFVLCKSGRHEREWSEISRYARECLNCAKRCLTRWDHSLRRTAWLAMYASLAAKWQIQQNPDHPFRILTHQWLVRMLLPQLTLV